MNLAAETDTARGHVAKVGHVRPRATTAESKPNRSAAEFDKCPGRAGTAVRDALEIAHDLAVGQLVFGPPLELWRLVARLVVARELVGTRAVFIDDRFSLVLGRPPAGCATVYDLGRLSVQVPAGCALLVERLHDGSKEWIEPVCLIEPYAWALGDWALHTTEETARILTRDVLPSLEAAALRAEARQRRPRFRRFSDFLEFVWTRGSAALGGEG